MAKSPPLEPGPRISDQERTDFLADQNRHQASLDQEVERLDSFMSLAMSQLE